MKYLEEIYDVSYHDIDEEIDPDAIVLYWEAPCTINGKFRDNYIQLKIFQIRKFYFCGWSDTKEWVDGFDLLCVESKINADGVRPTRNTKHNRIQCKHRYNETTLARKEMERHTSWNLCVGNDNGLSAKHWEKMGWSWVDSRRRPRTIQ